MLPLALPPHSQPRARWLSPQSWRATGACGATGQRCNLEDASGCLRALLFDRRSLRLFRVFLSVALLLEQLDLLLTGDLYAWIIDGRGVLGRHVVA